MAAPVADADFSTETDAGGDSNRIASSLRNAEVAVAALPEAEPRHSEKVNLCYYLGVPQPARMEDLQFEGKTLFEACENGAMDQIAALIIGGVDPNAMDTSARRARPLHYAMRQETTSAAEFLLDNGADVDGITGGESESAGQTPLMWAVSRWRRDQPRAMAELLISRGAQINATDAQGRSVLVHCLSQPPTMAWAVAKGAAVGGAPDPGRVAAELRGRTAAHWAAAGGHRLGLQFLIDRHAKELDLSGGDAHGVTPLHLACGGGHLRTAQLLLAAGADASVRDRAGRLPGDMPGAPPPVRALLTRFSAAVSATERGRATEVRFSNTENLAQRNKLTTFLVAFFFPNVLMAVASTLPTIFGFVVLGGCMYCVHWITQRGIKSKTPDPGLAGWYSGGLTFGSCVLIYFVFPLWDSPVLKAVWWALTVPMALCYVRAMLADPGAVRGAAADREEIYKLVEQNRDQLTKHDYCLTSMARKPCRSKFCTTSKKLVHRFDHYCVWTCNTIGAGNHRYFFFFSALQLPSQMIVQWAAAQTIFWIDWERFPDEAKLVTRSDVCSWMDWFFLPSHAIVTYFLFCYNLAIMFFIGTVFGTQVWYMIRNVTSNEVWFAERYPWCFRLGTRVYTMYDRGALHNIWEFLFAPLECRDMEPPGLDSNPYLQKKIARYNERMKKRGLPPLVISGSGGAASTGDEQAAGGGGSAVPPQTVSLADKLQAAGATEGDGFHRDPDTGLMMPHALVEHVSRLPVQRRREMAAAQRDQFQRFGMTAGDGQISLPPPEKQKEFISYMQSKISSVKQSGILDRLAGDGAVSSSSPPAGGPPPPSAHGYGDGLEAAQAREHRLGGDDAQTSPRGSGESRGGAAGEVRSRSGGGVARSRSGARRDLSDP